MHDLREYLTELAEQNPNMRAYRVVQKVKAREMKDALAFEKQKNIQAARMAELMKPARRVNWFERLMGWGY